MGIDSARKLSKPWNGIDNKRRGYQLHPDFAQFEVSHKFLRLRREGLGEAGVLQEIGLQKLLVKRLFIAPACRREKENE